MNNWERIGKQRRAGIWVPLFSVYSRNSQGIGDFADLKLLIDWANQSGNSIIQLLPMNEVGHLFCPYDALSSFALEPMYISLAAWPKKIQHIKRAFPAGRHYVNYAIKKAKRELLWEIYLEQGVDFKELNRFKEENNYWLKDFALFKVLKDYHQGRPWYEWEDRYKNRNQGELDEFYKNHKKEVDFQVWVQWLAFTQFKQTKKYAETKNVLLKGDLPILVSRDSQDVWVHPEFFKLEFAAGAPPDMYAALGQRWGMPIYNWEKIADGGYRYLKEKLHYAENFYDILRIDHVVGIFRIWSIPYHEPEENKGWHGFFDPKDETKWEEHARKILSVILKSTKMLICAEDLGVIPKICPKTLEELGIPGNDVQRWIKDWKIKHDFLGPKDYRYLSVAMLSTHDTTNWPAWWENEAGTVDEGLFKRKCAERGMDYVHFRDKLFNPPFSRYSRLRWLNSVNSVGTLIDILDKKKEEILDFIDIYENTYQEKEKLWRQLDLDGEIREKSDTEVLAAVFKTTLEASSIFCIQSLIDWLYLTDIFKNDPYAYRINTPGTISEKNWSLVIPLSLEQLLKHKVCHKIKAMIVSSGRDIQHV